MERIGEQSFKKGPDVLVMIVLAVVALGAFAFVWLATSSGAPLGDELPKVLGAGALGALGVVGLFAMTRELIVVGTEGLLRRNVLGTKVIRFEDVTSVGIQRVRSGSELNSDLRTGERAMTTTLSVGDGKKTIEVSSGSFGRDASLEALGTQLTTIVAEKLLHQSEAGRVELIEGVSLVEGRVLGTPAKSTHEVPPNVAPPRLTAPRTPIELDCRDPSVTLLTEWGWGYLRQGSRLVAVVSVGTPNFFPMLEVLRERSTWAVS